MWAKRVCKSRAESFKSNVFHRRRIHRRIRRYSHQIVTLSEKKSSETHQLLTRQCHKMKIMHRNLVNDDQHPILIQAANILSEWGFNKFRKHSFAPLKEYICMLNPSGCTLVYKKDVDEENKTDLRTFLPFQTRCECSYSKCYQIQCVHELSKYGKVIPNFFSKRWLRRDGNTNQHSLDLTRILPRVTL